MEKELVFAKNLYKETAQKGIIPGDKK
jgi:hypothetical protein